MTKNMLYLILWACLAMTFEVAAAQQRASSPDKQVTTLHAQTTAGDPVIEQCLEAKLGVENLCVNETTSAGQETCVAGVWEQCQTTNRMKIPTISVPEKYLPRDKCPKKSEPTSEVDSRATNSGQAGKRMIIPTRKPPHYCQNKSAVDTPDGLAAEPQVQKACSSCSGTCQTVSWFSGHSSYNEVNVGGGQSPSQCIDKIEQICEAGASRYMFGATCKN